MIVSLMRDKLPKSKILILAPFPYGERPHDNSRGIVLENTARIVKTLADSKHIFFLDIGQVFLKPDGSMNKGLMPDCLHPSVSGALLWAKAMEPTLSKLMGDEPKDIPTGGLTNRN